MPDPSKLLALLEPVGPEPAAEVQRDRYRGALVGLAVGNALGVGIEGLSKAEIARVGRVYDIAPEEAAHDWDDDVAQAIVLAEALLEGDVLGIDDLALRLMRWRRENGKGIGLLTAQVLSELERGTPADAAARQVWERGGKTSAGNGAVMRCAPVALRWRRSPRELVRDAMMSALVTHHDPRCVWSTVATVGAIALTLAGRRVELEALADALSGAGAPDHVGEAVRRAEGGLDDLELDGPTMGYTLKAMQVGLWALRQGSFEDALVEVVNAGGDTDTNGAVAGAALGAKLGASSIPPRWLARIRDAGQLEDLADRLLKPNS